MRINKFLAKIGLGSRREIDQYIEQGKVLVNKSRAKLGHNLEIGDIIKFQNQEFIFEGEEDFEKNFKKIYLAFFKPKGLICSNNSLQGRTIFDHLQTKPKFPKEQLHYIGRLDKDSRGLMILTNDGELTQRVSHPKYKQEKEYIVSCKFPITKDFLNKFSSGLLINKEKKSEEKVVTKACFCQQLSRNQFRTVIKQGYNRQIRSMVSKLGNDVVDLLRVRIGNIALKDYKNLNEGEFVEIKYFKI